MKTFVAKPKQVQNAWYLVDASGWRLGRLAALLAQRLRGKHRPDYTPHVDTGDRIVVINASELAVTGNKASKKLYHWHTGYPGGLRERTFSEMQARRPGRVLELAVKGMLPRGPLGRTLFKNLKVFAGIQHDHQAQTPQLLELARAKCDVNLH